MNAHRYVISSSSYWANTIHKIVTNSVTGILKEPDICYKTSAPPYLYNAHRIFIYTNWHISFLMQIVWKINSTHEKKNLMNWIFWRMKWNGTNERRGQPISEYSVPNGFGILECVATVMSVLYTGPECLLEIAHRRSMRKEEKKRRRKLSLPLWMVFCYFSDALKWVITKFEVCGTGLMPIFFFIYLTYVDTYSYHAAANRGFGLVFFSQRREMMMVGDARGGEFCGQCKELWSEWSQNLFKKYLKQLE